MKKASLLIEKNSEIPGVISVILKLHGHALFWVQEFVCYDYY